MGALSESAPNLLGIEELKSLFAEQHKYLDYFFRNLNYEQIQAFVQICLETEGVVFLSGVGKSGYIAQKISQTLVSTGTKSVFLSPTDALHGDIGMVSRKDVVVMFSKSGSTEEVLRLVPCVRAKGAFVVGISSLMNSELSRVCDMHVHLPLERELCPFDLAPVTSTTIQMLFGDTVATALMRAKHLTREEYALNHPAGRIGKRLIFRVRDVMKKGDEVPVCKENDLIMEQLPELSAKGCGCLIVVDDNKRLLGTFTDGDLRRALKSKRQEVFNLTVGEMCNRSPRKTTANAMAVDAMQKMEGPPSPVTFLPVLDELDVVIGIVKLHDLVSAGL